MTRPTCATRKAFDRYSDVDGRCKAALPVFDERWGSTWPHVPQTEWCMHHKRLSDQLDPERLPAVMGETG